MPPARIYDAVYSYKDYAAEADRLHGVIQERSPGAATLLDVACGTGKHLEAFRRWYAAEGALTPDHELDDALKLMAREQVRRVPIVVRENRLVGMLAQADTAHAGKEKTAGEVVEVISRAPGGPRVAGPGDGGSSEVRRPESLADDEERSSRRRGQGGSSHAGGRRNPRHVDGAWRGLAVDRVMIPSGSPKSTPCL